MDKLIKIVILIVIICSVLLLLKNLIKTNYKNGESGNNKSIKEIEEYILNINSYKAKIKVTVKSNKNVNFYEFEQQVKFPQSAYQIATSPESLAGVKFEYKDGKLEITNTQFNLSKIYEDYPYVSDNAMFLTSFLEGYRLSEEKEIIEENEKIIMTYKNKKNKYNNGQKLYINKSTLEPENLQIYDVNNDCKVDIVYNEIEFNI